MTISTRSVWSGLAVPAALLALSTSAQAQNETALRAALEGRMVTVKVDMPGTSKGIDVFPEEAMPVDWRDMATRMKENGTSLRIGQSVMITKVVVNKDSHIEIQLGGGGYGTMGDYMSNSSSVSSIDESESKLERQLRDSVKSAPNAAKKKDFERQLTNARTDREQKNARARAAAAQANELREANLRVKRAESGSRFNIRYKHGMSPEALTVDGVRKSLASYVDFAGGLANGAAGASGTNAGGNAFAPGTRAGNTGSTVLSLRKGLLVAEVEALLGPANTANESKEGSLTVVKRNYVHDGQKIATAFVNGVLIDFSITPE